MENGISRHRHNKLKITSDEVVNTIVYVIETDGVDAAKDFFELMNKYFSIWEGWPSVAKECRRIIAQAKKQQQQQQLAEKLAMQRAGAPNFLFMNQNEANATKDARNLYNHEVTMTGNQAVYNEGVDDNQ